MGNNAGRISAIARVGLSLFVMPLVVDPATAQKHSAARTLKDASRALQADNAASFVSYFERRGWEDYARLETYAAALTSQNDLASSVQVLKRRAEGQDRILTVDWLLQIRPLNGLGKVEIRRQTLSARLTPVKQRWKIAELAPVEFFRP